MAGVRNFHASLPKGTSHIGTSSPKLGFNMKKPQLKLECTLELTDPHDQWPVISNPNHA